MSELLCEVWLLIENIMKRNTAVPSLMYLHTLPLTYSGKNDTLHKYCTSSCLLYCNNINNKIMYLNYAKLSNPLPFALNLRACLVDCFVPRIIT